MEFRQTTENTILLSGKKTYKKGHFAFFCVRPPSPPMALNYAHASPSIKLPNHVYVIEHSSPILRVLTATQ